MLGPPRGLPRDEPARRWGMTAHVQKKTPEAFASGVSGYQTVADGLDRLHLVSLHTLLALDGDEGNLLAFLQGLEAGALDGTEVHEQVRAAFRGDEAEALGVVEPLDGAGLTIRHLTNS